MAQGIKKWDRWSLPSGSQSQLTYGVSWNMHDRAIRRVLITGLTAAPAFTGPPGPGNPQESNHPWSQVYAELRAFAGDFHHILTNLPLARITIQSWGPTCAIATMDYSRRRVSVNPNLPPGLQAQFRTVYRGPRWYRLSYSLADTNNPPAQLFYPPGEPAAGFPAGSVRFFGSGLESKQDSHPDGFIWQQPGFRMTIPLLLSFDPLFSGAVGARLGTINSDDISFGPYEFAKYRVRFDGIAVDFHETNQGFKWEVGYQFVAVRGGWWQQHAYFGPPDDGVGPPTWMTREGSEFPALQFANQFPGL